MIRRRAYTLVFIKQAFGASRRDEPAAGHLVARKGFPRSIRGNLILILCTLLIPTLMIQVYTYYDKFESRHAGKLQANLEVARAVAKTFESFVQNIFGEELILGLACGQRPARDQNHLLLDALTTYPVFWLLAWADPAGIVLASTDAGSIGKNLYSNPFFQELASGQDFVVTNLIHSGLREQPHFYIGRAIRGENGDLLGVLIAGVLPERLDAAIGIKRSNDSAVGLVDRQGRLAVSYPQANYTWEQRNWLSAYPAIKNALESNEVVSTVASNFDSVNRLVAFIPIPSIGWVAAATLTEQDAMADIRASLLPATVMFVLITLVACGIALSFSRKISNSIEKLRDHALALGRGENQGPLTQSGNAELDDLNSAFNKMSDDLLSREQELRKSRDELELRVRERTAELEKANKELRQMPSKLMAAQEEERRRLAAELHDSVGQTLVALKFRLENILISLQKGENDEALRIGEEFVPTIQHSIEETRAIYMGLRPKVLEEFGVIAALRWYRQEMLKLYTERHVELDIGIEEKDVPEHLHIPIFRIAQEALNNASKHSKAEWVDISLSRKGNEIELVISDDGVGMDLELLLRTSTARTLGLTTMRERAELSGGSFFLESIPGEGTTIRACWPIED